MDPNVPALIRLLADDHPEIVEVARKKLTELGPEALSFLEKAAREDPDPKVRVELQGVLERRRLAAVSHEWQEAAAHPDEELDLEASAFLLAKVLTPDLDPKPYQRQLDEMAQALKPRLSSLEDPKAQLALLNRFLFKEQKFQGNRMDYFDPLNSYLNFVLDRKLGIPISLSVLYLLVAKRLKLPLSGAGIPGHFMVKYQNGKTQFFIDPFNEGRFLSRPECVEFIVEAGYPYQVEFLEGVTSREILARMLRNLIFIYMDRQEETLEKTLTRFLDILYPSS